MILLRFSSSTVGGSEVGSIRRIYAVLFVLVFIWHMSGISYTRYLSLCFIRIGRMIWSVHSCQCANIKHLFNSSSYSGPYCFRPYIIPLAILVYRSVIFGRYCIIRLLQSNVISICLALNRLNKFNNISYQFSILVSSETANKFQTGCLT